MAELDLIKLQADPEIVEGKVHLCPDWAQMDAMARVDLLSDWLAMLEELYNLEAKGKPMRDIVKNDTSGDIPEKLYHEVFGGKK